MPVSADIGVVVVVVVVVVAIVDGTDRDRHLPAEALARSPVAGRTARPPDLALPDNLNTPKRRRVL
jgi:hypothetical protein